MDDRSRSLREAPVAYGDREGPDPPAFTADELAALLTSTRERVLILDGVGRLRKRAPGDEDPAPAEDEAVPEQDRQQLRETTADCMRDGQTREVMYRVMRGGREQRFHASLQRAGRDTVLFSACNITARHAAEAALATRYAVEQLTDRLSAEFINIPPNEIDTAIERALAELGRYCGADRAWLYQFTARHGELVHTHGWRTGASPPASGDHMRIAKQQLPWLLQRLRDGDVVRVDTLAKLPADAAAERQWLARHGVQSLLAVPITYSGELQGLMGFEVLEATQPWSTDEVHLLGRTGGIFASALQRKRSEQRIFRLAHYDQLTGLPNRMLLRNRLHARLRSRHASFALVLIDLDDASMLNDLLGHDLGDRLLKALSHRLEDFAGADDTVARWGGDAFMLTMPLENGMGPEDQLSALRRALGAPLSIDGHKLRLSACMGVACHPHHASNVDEMIRFAEMALGQAQQQGKDSLVVFDSAMQERAVRRNRIEHRLRQAVEGQEFDLHYQPQICASTGRLLGAEALIRWYDLELGYVPPDRFISLAEDTGMILPIGEWLAERACQDMVWWRNEGLHVPSIAVNVSSQQLLDDHLPEKLEQELARHDLLPTALELEITESALMDRNEASLRLLQRLRELGVGVAVDDFGTGYSSLSQIKHLPVTKLKIDRSFIQDIFTDQDDRAIVIAIVAMARQLGLRVVAEGVETHEQLLFLREQGCDMIQGYIHGHAAAPRTFLRRVRAMGAAPTAGE